MARLGPALARWSRSRWLVAAALLAVTLGSWWNTLDGGFVWDDEQIVVGPATLAGAGGLSTLLLSPDEVRPYYRPLARASYVLDHALWGLEPRGYHGVSVGIHAVSVLLLFALALRLLGSLPAAALAALLLAVHPIGAEAVAFLSARNNLLALAFSLATALLLVEAERRRTLGLAWLGGLAFFLGLASKEPALMAGPVLALWLVRPGGAIRTEGLRGLRFLAPLAVALAAYLALRWLSVGAAVAAPGAFAGLWGRLQVSYLVVPRYLALLLYPSGLTIFHADPAVTTASLAVASLAWAALLGGVWLLLRHPTDASRLGLTWLALGYLPVANIVPIPSAVMAERFLYVLAPGLWLVAADLALRLWRAFPRTAPLQAIAWGLALVLLCGRTVVRNRDWHDDLTLARSALAVDPASPSGRYNLGVVLKDQGDLEGAARAWEATLEVDPRSAEALTQLGIMAARRGDLEGAERGFRRALELKPLAGAHFNLAVLCDRTRRPGEALDHYRAFLLRADSFDHALVPRAERRVLELEAAGMGRQR